MNCRRLLIFLLPVLPLTAATQDFDAIKGSSLSSLQKADTIFSFARKSFRKGRFDSVDYWLNKGQAFAKESGNPETQARYYVEKGNMYYMLGRFKEGTEQIHIAKPFLSNTESYDLHNSAMLIAGNCFSSLMLNDSALYYFHQCETYNNIKFPYRNWLVYSAIGELFNHADDPKQAEQYFQKAYNITKNKEGKPDHGFVLTQFANFYVSWNRAEEFGKLLAEYNDLMAERKKANGSEPSHNLLYITWTKNNPEERMAFMIKVRETSLAGGNYQQAILANGYIINYYEKNKQFAEAIKYAEENERLSESSGSVYNMYLSIGLKYSLLKKLGRDKEAVAVVDRLIALKDSIVSLQRREQVNFLEAKFQNDKKEKEIVLLNTNNELARKEIALLNSQKELDIKTIALLNSQKKLSDFELLRQIEMQQSLARENLLMDSAINNEKAYNLSITREKEKEAALSASLGRENVLRSNELVKERKLRNVLISGAALLLIAGGIILLQYRRQRSKNAVIQKQSDDLQVLMKEIHHRVKNNLQVISSLLDLQSMTIADDQASEAVKEGKNRVQSMALIHQNLYSEGNIKGIRTKEYINNLLQSLCQSYNVTNDRVKVKTDIDDLKLDVDTMIPLGLVLNELVSNSLKYAFRQRSDGELSVVLKKQPEHLLLRVSDNGTGYPGGVNIREGKSFGMKMIRAFAQKLRAKLNIYNNDGAVTEMLITKYNMA
ncbi:MAG: hypothetical protein HZB42_14305 [Sphingobacteriales bacterium]|nr:hypothetical protein [Sphingobacteriales bacterium]